MKKCKKCGADLKPGIKFCTKCGTPVDGDVESDSTVTISEKKKESAINSETMDNIKKHSLNYFSWYKESISKPSEVDYSNKYFGIVSIIISALLSAFAFYSVVNKIFTSAESAINEASRYYSDSFSGIDIPTGFKLYFQLFLIVLTYYAVFVLLGFVCKKYLINKDTNIFDYTIQLSGYGNSIMIFQLLLIIFLVISIPSNLNSTSALSAASISALSSFKFLVILTMIISSISAVAYISSIIIDKVEARLDKIYVAIITLLVSNAVVYFVFQMIANSMISKYAEMFKSLF